MQPDADAGSVLQALPEPALVIGADGRILFANTAAVARLGLPARDDAGLMELTSGGEAAEGLRTYLLRCSGSRSPLPGAVDLRDAEGRTSRFHCRGSVLQPAAGGAPARILLRLSESGDQRFSALAQKVRELNAEIRKGRRTQALLQEALRDRDLLLRELHHRVKNNIHMLAGMLSIARREAAGPDVAAVLGEASRRLAAIGMVHQMLYLGENLRGVRGEEFLARIGDMLTQASGGGERFSFVADSVEVPNDAAVPLALILNELMTNALKHGNRANGMPGQIRVGLSAADGFIELWVEDEGPGFDPAARVTRRTSGLGLVRGLARQLGGSFLVGRGAGGGARCVVRFQEHRRAARELQG